MLLKIVLAKQLILCQNIRHSTWCGIGIYGIATVRMYVSATSRACKRNPVFKNVSEKQKVRLQMWFDGENALFNAECITNNILAKGMLISVQNKKISSFAILNKFHFLNKKVLRGFHCISDISCMLYSVTFYQ
jgi:hypothetical protein